MKKVSSKTEKSVKPNNKIAPEDRKYDVMVQYDPILETEVSAVLKENKIVPRIFTSTYYLIREVKADFIAKLRDLMKDIKFVWKRKKKDDEGNVIETETVTNKVRYIQAFLYGRIIPVYHKNMEEVTAEDKKTMTGRQLRRLEEYKTSSKTIEKFAKRIKNRIKARKSAKTLAVDVEKKIGKGTHPTATNNKTSKKSNKNRPNARVHKSIRFTCNKIQEIRDAKAAENIKKAA